MVRRKAPRNLRKEAVKEARILKRIYLEDLKRAPREVIWELLAWGNPLVEEWLREQQ
jgi:hypothetical protein